MTIFEKFPGLFDDVAGLGLRSEVNYIGSIPDWLDRIK
jgi:hypothetical protein